MKIIFAVPSLSYRGGERVALNLAEGLQYKGHNATLLFLRTDQKYKNSQANNKMLKIVYPIGVLSDILQNNIFYLLLASPLLFYYLLKHATKADIVQSDSFPCLLSAAFFCKLFKKKLIWIVHDYDPNSIKTSLSAKIMHSLNQLAITQVNQAITVSPKTQKNLAFLFPQLPVTFILPPINTKRLDNPQANLVREKYQLQNAFTILIVGTLHPLKNQRLALDALLVLKQDLPNIKLLLVGGGDMQYVAEYARHLGLSQLCICAGFVPDDQIKNYYASADLVLVTSRSEQEGLNITLFEAMYLNRPTICVEGPGASHILLDNSIGTVVPPNAIEIATAVRKHYSNPNKLSAMITKANEFVTNNLTIDRYADQIINIYNLTLKSSSPSI